MTDQILRFFEPNDFAVAAYCVMPDHVHLLLEGLTEGRPQSVKAAVHDWKRRTGFAWKRLTGQRLWQRGVHDYVLRDDDAVPAIVRYLVGNR
jgi:REP element-mobilizing transposase RayT